MNEASHGTARYLETQIATASREQLVVLLYNGAIRFLGEAREAMLAGDIPRHANRIHRAQNVIIELMSSLDLEVGGKMAIDLFRLYAFFFDQLTDASINDNLPALDAVQQQMRVLRDAFQEAERIARAESTAASVKGAA
jgi:flagellar protein FliS